MVSDLEKKYKITDAMINFGGSFVQALGKFWRKADSSNKEKLETAFLEYFEKYETIAKNVILDAADPHWEYDNAKIKNGILYCPECDRRIHYTNLDSLNYLAIETFLTIRGKCLCSTDWRFTFDLRNIEDKKLVTK